MEIAEHIAALRAAGRRLAEAAADCDLDAPVPTCPDWRLRDLVHHVGTIHRWATSFVNGTRRDRYDPFADMTEADWPPDAALVDWFRAGHAGLVQALDAAPPDLDAPTFLPAPSPLAFWARRQAHETTIHRVDAESPSGAITPCPPAFACDGIDEILFGFAARRGSRLVADPPQRLALHTTDLPADWLIEIGPSGPTTRHEHGPADCTVSGPAADLYLLLWNRRPADGLDVAGDASLLDRWRTSVQVRWR